MGVYRLHDKGESLVYYKPAPRAPVIEFDSGFELYISDEEYVEFEKLFDDETVSEEVLFEEALKLADKQDLREYILNNKIWGKAHEVDGIGPRGWNIKE